VGWTVGPPETEAIALGAGVLGTGGGGNPYLGKLRLLQQLKRGTRVEVIDPASLADDAVAIAVSGMGAPTVSIEKPEWGREFYEAFMALERHTHTRAVAVVPGEIGGANSITPLIVAAQSGLPCVDCDPMGRAFPELQMDTFSIYGVAASPCALCDDKRNILVLDHAVTPQWAEQIFRAATIAMGGHAGLAMPYLRGEEIKRTGIWYTMSLARDIGQAVLEARTHKESPIEAVLAIAGGKPLFAGKIVDVERRTVTGFARGNLTILGHDSWSGEQMRIDFQNENLIAWLDGGPVATVPDLICILEESTGEPIGTEMLRYGLRVSVLGLPADEKLKTDRALAWVGPGAFGYDVPYRPLETKTPGKKRADTCESEST
jgi:DUF917 family protein